MYNIEGTVGFFAGFNTRLLDKQFNMEANNHHACFGRCQIAPRIMASGLPGAKPATWSLGC
jgi:hypothetical protein